MLDTFLVHFRFKKKSLYFKNKLFLKTFFAETFKCFGSPFKRHNKKQCFKNLFKHHLFVGIFWGKIYIYFTRSSKAVLSFYSLETVENLQLFTSKALYKESTQKAYRYLYRNDLEFFTTF